MIDKVVQFLVKSHGKGLRPTLVLLSAKLDEKPISDAAIRAAVVVELLHEATLVHDDVVDESSERRGLPSLAARFKNKVSVLFGDYMLSNVLTETLNTRDLKFLDILSDTARRMAKGELVQAARAKRLDLTESDYMEMIGNKTAALFSACCRMGRLTNGNNENDLGALDTYGTKFGIAFQIKDDLLDLYGKGDLIGKPTGGDLKDRKLTLPILISLKRSNPREAKRMRARIRRGVKRNELNMITDFIDKYDGKIYAEDKMRNEAEEAVRALSKFKNTQIRNTLEEIVEFAITRRR